MRPGFADDYQLACAIELASGWTVHMHELCQWMTYSGLFDEPPTSELNDSIIRDARNRARSRGWNVGTPHLIEPARKRQVEPPGFDPPGFEWLPAVTCICGLEAPRSTRDDDLDLSVLTLIWFQDEYALPIQEDVATAIHLLDWDRLATNIRL
ncbi:MAG: hypothetical protein R3B72_43460 [Polyangiaceae bacterium]